MAVELLKPGMIDVGAVCDDTGETEMPWERGTRGEERQVRRRMENRRSV